MRKIFTMIACATLTALCLTACGTSGSQDTTPTPDNTATAKAETVAPTSAPTDAATLAPTEEPTETPVTEIGYIPTNVKLLSKEYKQFGSSDSKPLESDVKISEELAYKIFQKMFPGWEDEIKYVPSFGAWIPEKITDGEGFYYAEFEYISLENRLLVFATGVRAPRGEMKRGYDSCYKVFTFTYDGEIIDVLWENEGFFQLMSKEGLLFTYNDKLYFSVIAHKDSDLYYNGTYYNHYKYGYLIYLNPFWIYEIGAEDIELVWDESILTEYNDLFDLERAGLFYKFNGDGVELYLSEYSQEQKDLEFVKHLSFEKLLNDLDTGVTSREEPELTEEETLQHKMFHTVFFDTYYDDYTGKNGSSWRDPRNSTKTVYKCDFYEVSEYILFVAERSSENGMSDYFDIATFTKDGDLISLIWSNREFWGGNWDYTFFSYRDKIYLAAAEHWEGILQHQQSRATNHFSIYEFESDGTTCVWTESTYFPSISYSGESIEKCQDAYCWHINGNGVDMYFYNEDYKTKGYDFIRHYSFEELLSGVDVMK